MKTLMIGLLTMAGVFANAESSVWKVSKGASVLYVGATCHLLRETDFPLPPEFDKAFKAASLTVFETDIGKLQDPATQHEVLKRTMYADGSTVDKHLSPASYGLIQDYCSSNNLPVEALNRFKPSMLMVTISAVELMKMGATQQGVDAFYHKLAKQEGKPIEGLETVEEQLNYIVSMADGHEDDFVRYSMEDLKKLKETFDTLVAAWRKGDDEKIDALMARTRGRPLPQGEVNSLETLLFSGLIGGSGLFLLYTWVNPFTMWLTFATFVGYAVIYTIFLKPNTSQNIVIGGASGAMPPVLGWAAVTGDAPGEAWLLFLIIFVWTPPHFWSLALYRTKEYAAAGLPMLPVTHGAEYTRRHVFLYTVGLTLITLVPYVIGMAGWFYLTSAVLLDTIFLGYAWLIWKDYSDAVARITFRWSIMYLALLFAALLVDHYLPPW